MGLLKKTRPLRRSDLTVSGLAAIIGSRWQIAAARTRELAAVTVPEATGGWSAYAASYSPSLLARPWYWQGLIAGLSAMFGYQGGLWTSWAVGATADKLGVKIKLKPGIRQGGTIAGATILAAAAIAIPLRSVRWHQRTAAYSGVNGPNAFWAVASAAAAAATFTALLAQWRATVWSINFISSHLHNRLAWQALSRLISTLVVTGTILVIFDQVIMRSVVGVATTASARVDLRIPNGVHQPATPLHSGSPTSLESWDSLGLQGKRFTCAGPSAERIAEVMGSPAGHPIRAYASMNGRSTEEVVDAVLAELDAMNAWTRKAILIVTTTGRGNVNEWSTSSFEFLTHGDCATAAMQYSGLPSAVTMLSSKQIPVHASRMLFGAIEERVAALPFDRRPQLYVAGESLGAFGSNGIFSSPEDMLSRACGGVWTGCPTFAPNQTEWTRRRSSGSTVVRPIVDRGRHVRFACRPDDLLVDGQGEPLTRWTAPRFCYLQNDTDPVVWWGTHLLWKKPEWLDEMRGTKTPMSAMTWWPFITFWQIAADMPVCRDVGPGYGHKYHAAQCVPAWAGVLGLDPAADWSRLIDALNIDVPPVNP
ncbi:alpha/beta-hydrolase family protein [Brooklawnia sp.]|uniref:alpha/beta-hydrolase family protein n=1 Tax=Brooklawnia sp. TaxID=2699740 RepID=UPI00311EB6A1